MRFRIQGLFDQMRRKILIALIIISGIVIAAEIIYVATHIEDRTMNIEAAEDAPPEETPPTRAELMIMALAAAYPGRIEKAELRGEDWALLMGGVWYCYAGGRILPETLLNDAAAYSASLSIPSYPVDLPPWTEPSPEQGARFRERGIGNSNNSNERNRLRRSYHFHEALWQAGSSAEASRQVVRISFLGRSIVVHSGIAEVLSLVEERINSAAATDSEVRSWISGIGEMHGWNWRNVAGSQSRSYHSYGIAVDILPRSLGGKATYWQWAAEGGREWWNIPYENRYHPPDAVIKAFEAYGFIWGGKWVYFDTMHFEYRPEVFILSGIGLSTLR